MQFAYTRDRPAGPFLLVDTDTAALRRALGQRCFGPNWQTSHCHRGENLNLARSSFENVPGHPDLGWWQVHVRGWTRDDGVAVRAHFEPDPQAHPSAHMDGTGYDVEGAMAVLKDTLVEMGVPIVDRVEQLPDL